MGRSARPRSTTSSGARRSAAISAPSNSRWAPPQRVRGYHKPIMIAGGMGNVRRPTSKIRSSGGRENRGTRRTGNVDRLGGGAASSVGSGGSSEDLDFASVQRGNPEIQRRAQEVIDHCWSLGEENPIALIHDVGAGGLSNAVPEAVAHRHAARASTCAGFRARRAACRRSSSGATRPRSAMCWRSQPTRLAQFAAIAQRERCPFAVIGEIDGSGGSWYRSAVPQRSRSTCRWRCCSASRRGCRAT